MTRSSRPRATAELSKPLHQQLNTYALAASAAGVSMLALSQPAEAKIVYTPAHVPIRGTVNVDLNHDGIVDLKIKLFPYGRGYSLRATSVGQDRVWGSVVHASHLRAGVTIGPNQKKFAKARSCPESSSGACKLLETFVNFSGYWYSVSGPWVKHKNGYLGLKFYIQRKVHFGWARLHRANLDDPHAWVLTGYAYETIPGKPIVTGQTKGTDDVDDIIEQPNAVSLTVPTPEPPTLGVLALGAPGLSIWRREESVSSSPEGI